MTSPKHACGSTRKFLGIKEEHLVAMLMVPVLFGCLFTQPFIVEVEEFNSGSPTESLTFAGGDNETVAFNISKYAAIGNWTSDGIFRNFTVQLCPTAGTPSNLRIYWPYTNNSYLMWAGNLVGCQNVNVDTSGFDPYFETEMMPVINFIEMFGGGTPNISFYNTMMLREPHMYDVSEEVWFTMVGPYELPSDLISNMTGMNITINEIYGIGYTCYDGDSIRYVTQYAEFINTSALAPNTTLPLIGTLPFTGLINASAVIYDMYCPPYLAEGKYRAEIKKINISVDNASVNYSETMFYEDFDGASLNASWLVFSQTGPEIAYYDDSWTSSTVDLYSTSNGSGILMYYDTGLIVDENNYFIAGFNVSTATLGTMMASNNLGIVFFANETIEPGTDVGVTPYINGMFMFGNDSWGAVCPDMDMGGGPPAVGLYTPGWHVFAVNFTNDTQEYFVDGVSVLNCTNFTNKTLYAGVSSDPLTNQLLGNISVEWGAANTYVGGVLDDAMFDDFDAPLDTDEWLVLAVNESFAYYELDDSKLWLYSNSPSNASGIIAYLINPPLLDPNELAQNVSQMNFSSYTNFTGFTIEQVGWEVTVNMDTSDANATDYSLGFFSMNFTWPPFVNMTWLEDSFRGGFVFNGTDGVAICPNGTVLGGGSVPPGNYTFGFLSTNETFEMYVNGGYIGSCAPVNETLFVALTSDSTVETFEAGTLSIEDIRVAVMAEINGSGDLWIEVPPGYAYADVIVCDCDDEWNREFEFDISSDTAGSVDISIVNISYESLIGYSSPNPSVSIDNSMFSWMAYDSNISDSTIRYQTGIGRSNIDNSKIIASDIDCADVSDSEIIGLMYISRNISKTLEDAGLGPVVLPWGDLPCGRIENSKVVGGLMIGGDIINSEIYTTLMLFGDFENAHMNNMHLSRGNLTMNFTRWGPGVSNTSLPIAELDLDFAELPLGCDEGARFAVDGAPNFKLKESNMTFVNCWLYFTNSPNIILDSIRFNNTLKGPTISLENATTRLTNMGYNFNVKLKQQEAYAIIWGLNTAVTGDIYLSSDHIHTENSMIALNNTNYTFLAGRNVTIVFENIGTYDGIYYYPEFTRNISLVLANGTMCNSSRCQNLTYNASNGELSFITNNFSSYAIIRFTPFVPPTPPPPSPPPNGGDDERMDVEYELICPDNLLEITITNDGEAVVNAEITLQYDMGAYFSSIGSKYTDSEGIVEFYLGDEGDYRLIGTKDNYERHEDVIGITLCEEQEEETEEVEEQEEEPPAEEPGEVTEEAPPEEIEEEVPEEIPEEEETVVEEPEAPPAKECCFLGICASLFGLCWYWWLLLIVLIVIIAIILAGTIFAVGKGTGRKRYYKK